MLKKRKAKAIGIKKRASKKQAASRGGGSVAQARKSAQAPGQSASVQNPRIKEISLQNDLGRFAIVAACFLLSGLAALLYQMAWLQKLSIVFGTSHLAVATVLAAYMFGLAVGALAAAKWVNRIKRPLIFYAVLEIVIGVSAYLVPYLIDQSRLLMITLFGGLDQPGDVLQLGQTVYFLVCAWLILAVPTICMGATLPLLIRFVVAHEQQIGPRTGLLYGVNTLGAVLGALLAGFLLVPLLGLHKTLLVGLLFNLLVFLLVVVLYYFIDSRQIDSRQIDSQKVPEPKAIDEAKNRAAIAEVPFDLIFLLMFFSGVSSFIYEVLWTRLLNHFMAGTLYAFATMLASFLLGIAIGGAVAGRFADSVERARLLFAGAQLMIALLSWLAYLSLDLLLPQNNSLASQALYAVSVMLPSTLFIGATFPLAVRIASHSAKATAEVSGRVYFWNTTGAIIGSILAGFLLLPELWFRGTLIFAASINLLLAVACLLPVNRATAIGPARATGEETGRKQLSLSWGHGLWQPMAGLSVLLCILFVSLTPARPLALLSALYENTGGVGRELYFGVGKSASVMLREVDGVYELASDGLPESSILRKGTHPSRHSQKWLSALPALVAERPDSMLMIGFGGGVALEAVPPYVSRIDVVELEQEILAANRHIARLRANDPLQDPRLNIIYNDARNALALSSHQYDMIVSQPSHPWTGGAAHLYTLEYLQDAKRHLAAGGVFLQWINSRYIDASLFETLLATLRHVFPSVQLYQPAPHVLLFLCADDSLTVDLVAARVSARVARTPEFFAALGVRAAEDVVAALNLDAAGVDQWLRQRNTGAGNNYSVKGLNTDDHNLIAANAGFRIDGLDKNELTQMFAVYDPLLEYAAGLHQGSSPDASLNLPYMVNQLLINGYEQRAFAIARAVTDPSLQALLDGYGFSSYGQKRQATAAYLTAVRENPDNQQAAFALIKSFLPQLARGEATEIVEELAGNLEGSARAVVTGWTHGFNRHWSALQTMDEELAQVEVTAPWYPVAVKLRVDWRMSLSQQLGAENTGHEVLALLDRVLATYWNFDLFTLRAGAALLAQDQDALVESVWAASELVRRKLARVSKQRPMLSAAERNARKARLEGMRRVLKTGQFINRDARLTEVELNVDKVLAMLSQN